MNDYLFSGIKTDKTNMFFSKCQTKDKHFYIASPGDPSNAAEHPPSILK
jgi:hypothetical protein